MNNLEDLGKQSPPFLQSQLGEGVELFIDLLGGTSHPLTSKPALKSAREGMAFFAFFLPIVYHIFVYYVMTFYYVF